MDRHDSPTQEAPVFVCYDPISATWARALPMPESPGSASLMHFAWWRRTASPREGCRMPRSLNSDHDVTHVASLADLVPHRDNDRMQAGVRARLSTGAGRGDQAEVAVTHPWDRYHGGWREINDQDRALMVA